MLLAIQRAITWRCQSWYEVGAPYEVKRCVVDAEFGSMFFDELCTFDNTLLTLISSYSLLNTLIAFQNVKTLFIWSVYANLVVI